jgi:putative nucleotidyltransferase-like protein
MMHSLVVNPPDRMQHPIDTSFSAEFEFLLACCALNHRDTPRVAASLAKSPDWSAVLRMAEHHSVLPLVYQATRDFPAAIPAATLEGLRSSYEQNARRNLQFTRELFRILDCLEAHEISAIPYKGPALAETVYGDLALREFSDLDVLLRPADVSRAQTALRDLGYEPNIELPPAQHRAYLASGYEYTFDGPAGRNLLEIQWGIVPRFYAVDFSMEALFERATSGEINGRRVRALANEDLLLTLCVHAAKHAWIRLCWLRDVAGVAGLQLDWTLLDQRARDLGIKRLVGVGLILAQDLLGATAPNAVSERWRADREIEILCRDIARHLPAAEEYNVESLEYFRLMMRLRERASDRLRFASRLALTPGLSEWKMVSLPGCLFPLYRVVRLGRLAGRMFRSDKTDDGVGSNQR